MTKSGRSTPRKRPATKAGKQPEAPMTAPVTAAEAPDGGVFHTRGLLETCRTRWQYGEWEALAHLTEAEIAQDEDRARVAALVAAAHAHLMDRPASRLFALRAAEWGCDRRIIARLLLSGAANTLGRCATILEESETGETWFREAIGLVELRADAALLGHTRQVRETARLGLMEEARTLVDRALHGARAVGLTELSALRSEVAFLKKQANDTARLPQLDAPTEPPLSREITDNPQFNRTAYDALSSTSGRTGLGLVLETKSLPRAGLHYLRNALQSILGTQFHFCEWYLEPGCCGRNPCAHADAIVRSRDFRTLMLKSHDFDSKDPVYPIPRTMRRLILVRQPVFILTSWWCLEQIVANRPLLERAGIHWQRLFNLHEKPLLAHAFQIIEESGDIMGADKARDFLEKKQAYISSFIDKWGPAALAPGGGTIVPYEAVPQVLISLLEDHAEALTPEALERLYEYKADVPKAFKPRSSPFKGPTDQLTVQLEALAPDFLAAAEKVIAADTRGVLSMGSVSDLRERP